MIHISIVIGIILLAGLLGGVTNYLIHYDFNHNTRERNVNLLKSLLLGLSASITVPLFLQIIQTNLMEMPVNGDFPSKNYFVLFGFCVLAAIYSKRFLESVYSKIENIDTKASKAVQKAEEAKSQAEENEKEIKNAQRAYFNTEEANAVQDQKSNDSLQTIRNAENTMLAVATGKTFEDNLKYNIYYDPALRQHGTDFKFIGLYKYWKIRAIGEVKKIVFCNYDKEHDVLIAADKDKVSLKGLTNDETNRIKEIIRNTDYYDLHKGNKFFLVEKFYKTDYPLQSPIMGKQYFWLNEIPGFSESMSAKEVADLITNSFGNSM